MTWRVVPTYSNRRRPAEPPPGTTNNAAWGAGTGAGTSQFTARSSAAATKFAKGCLIALNHSAASGSFAMNELPKATAESRPP